MNCVFIGDSIAVGVAAHQSQCSSQAAVFQTTAQTVNKLKNMPETKHVIISVGSNDHTNVSADLKKLRAGITAACVTWLIPFANTSAKKIISQLAHQHSDRVLDIKPWISTDRIHPTGRGYQQLAKQIDYQCDHK